MTDIPRDRWGRPIIIPPDGGEPIPYQRASSLGKTIEDTHNLTRWKIRQAVRGVAARDDLTTAVQAARSDRKVDELAEQAMEAAGASAAANRGTAVHELTEMIDAGQPLPDGLSDDVRRMLESYRQVMSGLEVVASERFVVCDSMQAAGTFDRIVDYDGGRYVLDVKTGNTDKRTGRLAWVHGIAVQLAVYANGVPYDPDTGRGDGWGASTDRGLVLHLPMNEGRARLWWVDLAAGWAAAELATEVRGWRQTRGLVEPAGAEVSA